MATNYTPLPLERMKVKKDGTKTNTILLSIAVLTAGIFALCLFMVVQKKSQEETITFSAEAKDANPQKPVILPTVIHQSTETPTSIPTIQLEVTPEASISASVTPKREIIPSLTLTPQITK